jgi:hypothetical protein
VVQKKSEKGEEGFTRTGTGHAPLVLEEEKRAEDSVSFRSGTRPKKGEVDLGQEEKKRAGPKRERRGGPRRWRKREGERPREKKRRGFF